MKTRTWTRRSSGLRGLLKQYSTFPKIKRNTHLCVLFQTIRTSIAFVQSHLVPDTWHVVPDIQHHVLGIRCPAPGTGYQAFGTSYLRPRHLVPDY